MTELALFGTYTLLSAGALLLAIMIGLFVKIIINAVKLEKKIKGSCDD